MKQSSAKKLALRMVTLILKLNVSILEIFSLFYQKQPDLKNCEEVTKLASKLSITRADLIAKTIESRLLNVSDLMVAEARCHVPSRS